MILRVHRFSMWNKTTYRPTNEGCLMRQVVLPHFCKPCTEGLWHQLLKRVDLIDDLSVIWDKNQENVFLQLSPLRLGQFREEKPLHSESVEINWTINGTQLWMYANQTYLLLPKRQARGEWEATVTLHSGEVRQDPKGYLRSSRSFSV